MPANGRVPGFGSSGIRSGARLRLAVEDDGPGIAEHDRERVLQRGRRLDETTAGAGLGLAIVRDLAELYRGSLELRRSDLGGLCATLELPAAAPTAGSGSAIEVPTAGRSVRKSRCSPPG